MNKEGVVGATKLFNMNNRNSFKLILLFLGLTSIMLLSASESANAVQIGPGTHWVDTGLPGQDSFSSLMEFGVDITLDGVPEFDATFVGGSGTTVVDRSTALDDSIFFPGLRPVDGHLDVIDTEIVSMQLTGTGAATGWTLRAGVFQGVAPSLGAVAEQAGDNTLADSFFNVFFEIDGTPFGTLNNINPLRVEAEVDRLPPIGTDYTADFLLSGFIELFNQQGQHVANVTELTTGGTGHHLATPEPTTVALLGIGLVGLAGAEVRRRRKKKVVEKS